MEIALWGRGGDESYLRYVSQLGAKGVIHWGLLPRPGEEVLNYLDLVQLRELYENAGLKLVSIENLGDQPRFYDSIILGKPDRDQHIEHIADSIRILGRAGVPFFGYHWMTAPTVEGTNPVFNTSSTTRWRGGSLVRAFDMAKADKSPLFRDREYSEEEMWDNLAYFLRAIVPVAEESGVTISLHPHDPPVDRFGGIPRLFVNLDAFKRAMDIVDSPNSGLTFCLGNWSLMGPGVAEEGLRYFGERKRICYLHFQAVQGTPEKFVECFFEEGQLDFLNIMRILKEMDFSGYMMPAHAPTFEGEPHGEGGRAMAYSVGYLQALRKIVRTEKGGGP